MAIQSKKTNAVVGKVTDKFGRGIPNLHVAIHDADMREWQLLAETITDKNGQFKITWTHDQLSGRGKKTADIAIKVSTRINQTELYRSDMDSIRFNAGKHEEYNISLKSDWTPETIEFDELSNNVSSLAGEIAIAELEENKDHRDISFISRELDIPIRKIEHLVLAYRMEKTSRIEPAFFYALFRKNTLLDTHIGSRLNLRTEIGIETNEKLLLLDLTRVDKEKIKQDIDLAIQEKLVDPGLSKKTGQYLDLINNFTKEADDYYKNEHPQKVIDLLADLISPGKLGEMQKLYRENKYDLRAFFTKITDSSFYASQKKGKEAKSRVELGKLFGFGSEILPAIAKAKGIKKPADVRRLARLNKTEWVEEIEKAVPGLKDKSQINSYASAIVRKMEKEYPTLAFAAQLHRSKDVVLNHQDKLIHFFDKHEDFDFLKDNVDLYLKKKKISAKETEAIRGELKSIQRIFRLVPHYAKTIALKEAKVHSAQGIVSIGKERFIKEIAPSAGIGEKEALEIFRKAETRHMATMMMIGEMQDSTSVMNIPAFETKSLALKLEAVSEDFPNLQSLFRITDSCECEHCRSVYSPAAYLVEILEFLGNRMVQGTNAKSVLFSRRPELGEIDLGCANANTPVKYIDLVCEILEEAVSPDPGIDFTGNLSDGADPLLGKISNDLFTTLSAAGLPVTTDALIHETESFDSKPHYLRDKELVCKIVNTGGNNYKVYRLRQTFGTAEELDAAPEYVNHAAYEELKDSKFAFTLPFDLHHTEAKAYLKRFDVDRADLMETFSVAGIPATENISAERLGLTDAERKIIIKTPNPNNNAAQQEFWNVPAPGVALNYLGQVDQFLDRTGLKYKDLDQLLKLKFIDKDGDLFIKHDDTSCDTTKKSIANLDLDAIDRIHRFLRLQKKTGWRFEVLDEMISQSNLGNGNLDDDLLKIAADLSQIATRLKIKIEETTGFYGEMPHTVYFTDKKDGPAPLYHQIFQNKAKNGVIKAEFEAEKIDGTGIIDGHEGYIATCLGIKIGELNTLLDLLPNNTLDFANLSTLFVASRITKKWKIKAEEYIIWTELTGIDPAESPAKTIEFLDWIESAKSSPLKVADIEYLINHEATNLVDRELNSTRIEEVLTKIKTGYENVREEKASQYNDLLTAEEQTETLITVVSALEGMDETKVSTIVKFLSRDWSDVADANGAKIFIDDHFDSRIDRTGINTAIDALDALAPNADASAEQKALIKALLDNIAVFQITNGKYEILVQTIAAAFKADPEQIRVIITNSLLKQPAPGTAKLETILSDDLTNAISSANYPNQYAALRLIHKMLWALHAFKLDTTSLEWFLQNNAAAELGWFELDRIPYEAGQTATTLEKYLDFCQIHSYLGQLNPVIDPTDPENPISLFTMADMVKLGAGANRTQFISKLALLTGYDSVLLDEIDAHLFAAFDVEEYGKMETWKRVLKAAELATQLGATLNQISQFINPVLTLAETEELRSNLKAHYDEDTWLSTLKEVMDSVRPQKRKALVAYLLATNPELKDENGLYEYFLVDVEMEACMPSSRIVLAHSSIQLFVQRCLMGLEPDAIADTKQDPNWNQWKWMKNYRVWEANRKVFLYPENWYDVSLTDDKSYLLDEFIKELQQNELTNDTAEDALKKYLEKLDNIAFLEVMATWYEVPMRNMHVFARTKGGDPCIYYYRRFEKERYWTPWEKVELEITGNHLLAFMRNNRLHLAWPVFTEVPDPNQGATLPDQGDSNEQPVDKPRKKMKIQLAISEYTNKRWQPKKVSHDGILTPDFFTTEENHFDKSIYNLIYDQGNDQIKVFSSSWKVSDYYYLNGIFDIAGCKGYPELAPINSTYFPDFYPDFKDSSLISQRYNELNLDVPNDLSVRNAVSVFNYYELLQTTPGKFRLSYPHQFTAIDLIAFFRIYFAWIMAGANNRDTVGRFKIPLGTLLPYFKEDSNHAYVIIPGYYKAVIDPNNVRLSYILNDSEKRTASNVFQLMDDITIWFKKMVADFIANPPADWQEILNRVLTDSDFQDILQELSMYADLDFVLNLLVGVSGDPQVDEFLKGLIAKEPLKYGEQFKNMYHPLVCFLRSILNKDGIPALMDRDTQLKVSNFNFKSTYNPNPQKVPLTFFKQPDGTLLESFPIEDVDFSSDGSYSVYNWDLFYRVPLHIAGSLTKNQRFEEALTWFHYMFNPTGALPGLGVQKYWVTKPFYLNQETDYIAQRIDSIMYDTANLSNPAIKELEFAISEWRTKPFRPDVIARFRPVAYQKALLMKYIDNLVEWGDYLFRQDTMESIAQATQMYILADKLLGPKPRIVKPAVKPPYETYNQIEAKLDSFGNALVEFENILPDISVLPEGGAEIPAPPVTLSLLYFCIPANEKMAEYWDRVADRLFKIRHCQNIDGIERSLALFAPPIDPGMLVRAAASGLDLSAVLAGLNAPTPYYRFTTLSQKAGELAQEVRGLGNALLQTLEKKDAEAMALLRNELELKVLNAVKDTKKLQIKEAKEQIEILKRTKKVTEERQKFYASIQKISSKEQLNLDKLEEANEYQFEAQIVRTVAGALRLVPEFHVGASGFGGSPHVVLQLGGSAMSTATNIGADILNTLGSIATYEASRASILAGYDRRFDDWKLQERLALKEIDSINKQITAAEIRKEIAETELKNHELQIENAKKTDEFMKSKFTNKELYDWMVGQISAVYFKSYQLAHDFAKKAERCYRFELGNDDSFISFGYWDSMKKGLQTADHLVHDLKRMETSYLDKNKREYEITKHVSLAQLDPLALIRFKTTGICDFEVPEVVYDMDHPGQYFRRIKSVSISMPCVAGPYTSVSAKLSLINNRYRKNMNPDNAAGSGYLEDPGNDERFIYNIGAIQSIATSNGQNDSGVFELNFRDERYLPFENTGAISGWRLELPTEIRQFDYNSVADVILHIKYTAREGGSGLKTIANAALRDQLELVKQNLGKTGLHIGLNLKHDLPNDWHLLKKNGSLSLTLDKYRLPYMAQAFDPEIEEVIFLAKVTGNPANLTIQLDGANLNLARIDDLGMCSGVSGDIEIDTAFSVNLTAGDLPKLEELFLFVKYKF